MKVKYTVEKKNYGMQVEFHKCISYRCEGLE